MIWWTLLWLMIIPGIIISALLTIAFIGHGLEEGDPWCIAAGTFGIFFTVFLGWAIWVVYPFSAVGM